ncbi:DUF6777 domain-containing protein [Streptomyces sp. NPDC058642]|uniref:DUF6777 domain-containing protein n=1 Tax=Streptomyces sp. NPDC058642 TaxID=3346572 RepID=UPI00365126BC
MRPSTGTFVTACALATALIVVGCVGSGDKSTHSSGELFLQPVAAQGPDPFTDSTQTSPATPAPVTRTQQPARSGVRSISGGTPGLYGGTVGSGSCDVNRQIGHLTADPAKGRAFAQVEGISEDSIPSYLRSLTSVVLRADTQVTNHGYRDGRTTTYQSVLQSGTAVLVDTRGVPRVRCACGNPLTPARATSGGAVTSGRPWSGYRHNQVVVVAPTIRVVTHITIIDIVDNTWIERRCGHDTRHDHVVPRPQPVAPTSTPTPSPSGSDSSAPQSWSDASPHTDASAGVSASPSEESSAPDSPATDCVTPTATVTPGVPVTGTPATEDPVCPAATVTATPPTATVPDEPTVEDPSGTEEAGPQTVPDTPDVPDGGGLIPDSPDEPTATDSIFDSPTGVFGG